MYVDLSCHKMELGQVWTSSALHIISNECKTSKFQAYIQCAWHNLELVEGCQCLEEVEVHLVLMLKPSWPWSYGSWI